MSSYGFRSQAQRLAQSAWRNKYRIVIGGGLLYTSSLYAALWLAAKERDRIRENTFLYWRIFPGAIVEERTSRSTLDLILSSSERSFAEEPPRVLTIYEIREALEWAATDPSIIGLIADFSTTAWPNVPHEGLGLAQIEELHGAISALKHTRRKALESETHESAPPSDEPPLPPFRTVAVTDSFVSQSDYVLATAFDEIYVQQTGGVPLTGLGATIPFWSKLIKWIGINVHAEARTDWKSMVAPYTQERLTRPQRENELQLLNDLNDNFCTLVARSRYPAEPPAEALAKVKAITKKGPYSALQAKELGLITDVKYKREVINEVMGRTSQTQPLSILQSAGDINPPSATASLALLEHLHGEEKDRHMFGLYHYHRVATKDIEKSDALLADVGVVYLRGTIGGDGSSDYVTASVLRGLKEAAKDEDLTAVVLRVDSGGGGVVESDAIWDAVREVKEHGKIVIASLGNAAASGGFLAAVGADMILCAPSTVTGSIGVASLRPNVTPTLLDRLKLTVESFYLGSKSQSLLHELDGEELERHRAHIDETYEMFKRQVCDGRGISPDSIEDIAGGRVYTGLRAFEMLEPEDKRGAILEKQNRVMHAIFLEEEEAAKEAEEAKKNDKPETNLHFSVEIGSSGEDQASPSTSAPEQAEATSGPLGRGLTDGFGGLFDAAYAAFAMALERNLRQVRQENPGMSDMEVFAKVLPDLKFDGGVETVGVRLRTFPEEKTLWESAKEAARRGESIDPTMVQAHAAMLLRAVFTSVASVGLRQTWQQLGLGNKRGQIRAENSSRLQIDL